MELSWDGSFHNITQDVVLHAVWTEKHNYGTPAFAWSEDGKACQITFTCKNNAEHTKTEDCIVTSAVKTPATCQEMGVTTYTAAYQNDKTNNKASYTITKLTTAGGMVQYTAPANKKAKTVVIPDTVRN